MAAKRTEPRFFWKRVESFTELQQVVADYTDGRRGFIFRGYSVDISYDPLGNPILTELELTEPPALVTGLENVCLLIDRGLTRARERERALVREFKRRAHHYLASVPPDVNRLEWLALMQHHGAPTRLLDWTYSLHVAVHFALTHALRRSKTPAVWMVDARWCRDASAEISKVPVGTLASHFALEDADEPDVANALLSKDTSRGVWPVNPFRLNERLIIQKGVFLASGDPTATFVDNFTALPGHENPSCILRLILVGDQIEAIGKLLYDANVTDATLFPGLDGFARSLWLSSRYLTLEGLRP